MPPLTTHLCPLLTTEVIEKLARQGIKTVAGYVHSELVALSQSSGLPYRLLTSIRQSLLAQFSSLPATAANLWQELEDTAAILPTGCSNLDDLLEGGLMTGEVTELTGVPASGKTQLCHSVAVAAVLHTSSTVLWVDSSGGFSASRLHTTLTREGASEQTIPGLLERIQVHRLFNLFDLLGLLESVSERVSNQTDWLHTNLHLLLVDSVTPLLSPLLGGHGGQGHALLSHLASQLRRIAYEHSMAVVYTNNTVSDMISSGGVKPALGRSWSYVPHTRISLSILTAHNHHTPTLRQPPDRHSHTGRGKEEEGEDYGRERVATLTKSSRLCVRVSTAFLITEEGVLSAS